jgi:YHS domain-containing protein
MMKQISKQTLTMALVLPAILLGLLVAGPAQADALVTTVITDPLTGIAINGYDPVSYFIEPQPLEGKPDYEYYWQGVPWYFANAANRDVFVRAPEVYAPWFGGHEAMSAARGFLSDGNPRIYSVYEGKLYLFYSTGNRDAFLLAPDEALKQAEANWPALEKDLSP